MAFDIRNFGSFGKHEVELLRQAPREELLKNIFQALFSRWCDGEGGIIYPEERPTELGRSVALAGHRNIDKDVLAWSQQEKQPGEPFAYKSDRALYFLSGYWGEEGSDASEAEKGQMRATLTKQVEDKKRETERRNQAWKDITKELKEDRAEEAMTESPAEAIAQITKGYRGLQEEVPSDPLSKLLKYAYAMADEDEIISEARRIGYRVKELAPDRSLRRHSETSYFPGPAEAERARAKQAFDAGTAKLKSIIRAALAPGLTMLTWSHSKGAPGGISRSIVLSFEEGEEIWELRGPGDDVALKSPDRYFNPCAAFTFQALDPEESG